MLKYLLLFIIYLCKVAYQKLDIKRHNTITLTQSGVRGRNPDAGEILKFYTKFSSKNLIFWSNDILITRRFLSHFLENLINFIESMLIEMIEIKLIRLAQQHKAEIGWNIQIKYIKLKKGGSWGEPHQ